MTRLALVGALLVVAATAVIAVVAQSGAPVGPEGELRLLGAALFTTPAAIGLAGAWRRERVVLVAAGILCLIQSVLAFSGVTIVYLPAALAFLLAASRDGADAPAPPPAPARWRALHLIAVLAVTVGLALVVVRFTGIYGVLAVVVLGGLAPLLTRPATRRVPLSPASASLGVLVIGLVVGGWLAATGWTQEVCWVEREGATGIEREILPAGVAAGSFEGRGVVATGCDSGIPTRAGIAIALGLAGLGVTAALVVPTHRARGPVAAKGR